MRVSIHSRKKEESHAPDQASDIGQDDRGKTKNLLSSLSKIIAEKIGKPENYVMVFSLRSRVISGIQILMGILVPLTLLPATAMSDPYICKFDPVNRLLTLRAERVPLSKILESVAREAGIEITPSPHSEEMVSLQFSDIPLEEGLKKIMRKTNYALIYEKEGAQPDSERLRMVIFYPEDGNRSVSMNFRQERVNRTVREDDSQRDESVDEVTAEDTEINKEESDQPDDDNNGNTTYRELAAFLVNQDDGELKSRVGEALRGAPDTSFKERLVKALGQIGEEKVMSRLEEAIRDDDETVSYTHLTLPTKRIV